MGGVVRMCGPNGAHDHAAREVDCPAFRELDGAQRPGPFRIGIGGPVGSGKTALLESGGDNLTLTFSRRLVDYSIYVIDVAGGDKIPRKRGPGLIRSDLLVINKVDLAELVGASLDVMATDSAMVRDGAPTLF